MNARVHFNYQVMVFVPFPVETLAFTRLPATDLAGVAAVTIAAPSERRPYSTTSTGVSKRSDILMLFKKMER